MDTAQITRFLRGIGIHCLDWDISYSGNGYGNGLVCGYGSGIGCSEFIHMKNHKCGYGFGRNQAQRYIGIGNANGTVCGSRDENKFDILTYNGEPVYVVDGIPCVFKTVHDVWAKVDVINKTDFTARAAFIGKCKGFFAHGETLRKALQDAKAKYYQSIDFEAKKEELKALFSRSADKKLPVRTLYEWHGMLTGSCRFGRDEFMRTHALKDDDRLTLKEFVNLTAAHFGGEKIKELLE